MLRIPPSPRPSAPLGERVDEVRVRGIRAVLKANQYETRSGTRIYWNNVSAVPTPATSALTRMRIGKSDGASRVQPSRDLFMIR